jgi:hypothetical protein
VAGEIGCGETEDGGAADDRRAERALAIGKGPF